MYSIGSDIYPQQNNQGRKRVGKEFKEQTRLTCQASKHNYAATSPYTLTVVISAKTTKAGVGELSLDDNYHYKLAETDHALITVAVCICCHAPDSNGAGHLVVASFNRPYCTLVFIY